MILIAEFCSNPAPEWDFETWCRVAAQNYADLVKVQIFHPAIFPPGEQAQKKLVAFPLARFGEFVKAAHGNFLDAGASIFSGYGFFSLAASGDFIKLASREENNLGLVDLVRLNRLRPLPVYRSGTSLESCITSVGYGFTPLFCIPQYPTRLFQTVFPILRMAQFFNKHGLCWGWSSHTVGWLDCLLAVKLGATLVEKHLALSRDQIEAKHSLLPVEFRRMAMWLKNFSAG